MNNSKPLAHQRCYGFFQRKSFFVNDRQLLSILSHVLAIKFQKLYSLIYESLALFFDLNKIGKE